MFETNILDRYLSPLGYKVVTQIDEKSDDYYIYSSTITGFTHSGTPLKTIVTYSLPSSKNRVFKIEGSNGTRNRVICNRGFFDILNTTDIIPNDITIERWQYVYLTAINNVFSQACFDWKFGGEEPQGDIITQKVEEWFNTSPFIMDVKLDNQMQINSVEDLVILDIPDLGVDFNTRIFTRALIGKLDPCSTSASNKINLVYRLADGAQIKEGKIVSSDKIFCRTITNNAVALALNPRRAYLLRTTFENSVKLVYPEVPIVGKITNQLNGVNLLTAIMQLEEHTFEDCIAISQTAAKKLDCYVEKKQSVKSQSPLTILAKPGEVIRPGQPLAVDAEGNSYAFNKLKVDMCVIEVESSKRFIHGRMYNVLNFTFCTVYSLKDGDKLSNRGGVKGVVKIIPDHNMPVTTDGKIIDICLAPESVYKRRCMSMYWEMMAAKAIKAGNKVNFDYYNTGTTFEELVKAGFGDSQQLFYNLVQLPNQTYVGEYYWIRLNKHSVDMMSIKGEDMSLNQYGLKVDDPSASGQRRDFAKSLAMLSRDLLPVLTDTMQQTGTTNLNNYLDAILDK